MHFYSLIGALCREDADEFFASTSVPTKQETLHSTGHASAKIIRMLQFHNCLPVATFENGTLYLKQGLIITALTLQGNKFIDSASERKNQNIIVWKNISNLGFVHTNFWLQHLA